MYFFFIHIAQDKRKFEIVERQDEFCGISG